MEKITFSETQYLGRDYIYTTMRLVMIAFCFGAYVYERDRENTQDLFIIAGFTLLGVSIIMMFMKHYQTILQNQAIMISGSWTSSLVKIDLKSIVKARMEPYSNYIFNSPVYNLHRKGTVKFYTSGKFAVVLTDRDGLEYYIGSQRPTELLMAIENSLKQIKEVTT